MEALLLLQKCLQFKEFDVYVVHELDRLFSCQLCGAYTPRFPPSGEGMHLMEP